MRLAELEPSFLIWNPASPNSYEVTDDFSRADGITFLCPVCFMKHNGSVGTHSIMCWRLRVPQSITPNPGRWEFIGTGYDDLSLNNGPDKASSVQIKGGCDAHFHVTDGRIDICGDCKV